MIKRSLLVAVLLLFSWSIFIKIVPFSLSQHQWQKNIVVAEKFMFSKIDVDNVIVGSSLSDRLIMDSLPNFYNLAMSGQSVFDGLNIILNKKEAPKRVFIEINVLSRGENTVFKEIVSSPIQNALKNNSDIFKTDKHPISFIEKELFRPIIKLFFSKIISRLQRLTQTKSGETQNKNVTTTFFDKMLDLRKDEYSKIVDSLEMNRKFEKLSQDITILKSQGVKIIFFEMPINAQLVDLNLAVYFRNKVKNEYPHFDFIEHPKDLENYKTTDGHHLTKDEAKIYSGYLNKRVTDLHLN